ncbi:hypothetical protein VTK73DRAFT_8258 [Phialemonium thermophilum]|uniref:Uncharacterized protein n=1 Tax=Phialemonium thermophilum TaxID=223376 RepID=A0ABR3XPY3_9PEZI
MCIVLVTTAHPKYALIVLDNRDEYILRPTSRPHWWTPNQEPSSSVTNGAHHRTATQEILSSRDLQRPEHGTWLGITKAGHFAVLTNYRETDTHDATHPVSGTRSRGGMVTAWLGADPSESTAEFIERMLQHGDVKGVGGFSLLCGKLRRRKTADGRDTLEPLAILSNRSDSADEVPWLCGQRDEVHGLSNTHFSDPKPWPKVENGVKLVREAIKRAVEDDLDEDRLTDALFGILDSDTLPIDESRSFEAYIPILKESIFIPAIGGQKNRQDMLRALEDRKETELDEAKQELRDEERPDQTAQGFDTGMYGTQRQTVLLVDWDGNVTYKERALWDSHGVAIPRGEGDMSFKFKIEGWT